MSKVLLFMLSDVFLIPAGLVVFATFGISFAIYAIRKLKQAFALAKEQGIEITYMPPNLSFEDDFFNDIIYDPFYSSCSSNVWHTETTWHD